MTIAGFPAFVRSAFFKPVSPYPLALFRIAFGLCCVSTFLLLHRDWLIWFGVHGWIRMSKIAQAESGLRLNLFLILPSSDDWAITLYWVFLIGSISLIFGFRTRLSSVIVFAGLDSINQRLPLILHGGDAFLRIAGFFLIFAPAGVALSVDSILIRRRVRGKAEERVFVLPWAQRLIQYQLAIIYLMSFWWKLKGDSWRHGTALYYVTHLREIQRFPLPRFLLKSELLHFGTWAAMAFELGFPLLIWFRPFRKPLLLLGVAFHLCLEYALNIPMFQWDMLSAYPLFLDGPFVERLVTRIEIVLGRGHSSSHRTVRSESVA